MPNLPLDAQFNDLSVTEQAYRAATSQLLSYLRTLLGDSGDPVAARSALGLNGVPTVFNSRGAWVTATLYLLNDVVTQSGVTYLCLSNPSHTSGTFATDLAAGKWMVWQGVTLPQLAGTGSGQGASQVGLPDAAGNYDATDVEAALAEIAARAYSVPLERYATLCTTSVAPDPYPGELRWDAAYAAARAAAIAQGKPIFLGSGIKYFTNGIDNSTNGTTRDGLTVFGCHPNLSKLVIRSTTGACMEVQGVSDMVLRDFQIGGNPAVGIATGRGTVRQWGGHHWYDGIRIILADDMAKNSNIGTIAFLGIEPEESCWTRCEFWANLPVIIAPPNNISVRTLNTDGSLGTSRTLSWTPQYTPIVGTLLSNTVFHFDSGCRMVAWQPDSPVVSLRSVSSVNLGSSFLQTRCAGGNVVGEARKNPYGIDAENCWGLKWFGTHERNTDSGTTSLGALIIGGTMHNIDVTARAGTCNTGTMQVPAIYGCDSVGGTWDNNTINLSLNGDKSQYPIKWSSASTNTRINSTKINVDSTAVLNTINTPILYSMTDSAIVLQSANAATPSSLIVKNRYSQEIHVGKDVPYSTPTVIARVYLPASGLSAGVIGISDLTCIANYIYVSGSYIAARAGSARVSWSRTSVTTALTAVVTQSYDASNSSASSSLDIASLAISATIVSQTQIDIVMTVTLSGTAASGITTRCEADIKTTGSLGFGASTALVTPV